jgi:hypothetical protein
MWRLRRIWKESDRGSRAPGLTSEVYEEPAFRHFLGLERRRAERRGRSLLLLLVDLGHTAKPTATVEQTVFEVLGTCVRETDFLGWYDAGRVAGAVLVQGDAAPTPAVCRSIGKRVAGLLKNGLDPDLAPEVRVLQLPRREERHA